MGFFKKKKADEAIEEFNEEQKKSVDPKYRIILKEDLGGPTRTIKIFYAERWIDPDDSVVYLRNKKQVFLEIFPENLVDFVNFSEKEVNVDISKLKNQLKKRKDLIKNGTNPKNLDFELQKLEAKKRSFKFKDESSYISFATDGRPEFYFLRRGSTFYPFKWDVETKTVYVPSDNKKKKAAIALKDKRNKYKPKQLVETSIIIIFALCILFLFANLWGMYKIWATYDQSEIAASTRLCLDVAGEVAKDIEKTAQGVNVITESINDKLIKPPVIIEGILPK